MISKVREINYPKIRTMIDELCISNLFFKDNVVQLMKNIVPEYISNNSDFCKLDKKENITFEDKAEIKEKQPHSTLN